MNDFFRRRLSEYAGYHRDERNRLTHDFGIPIIFLAVVLPLSVWPVTLFGIPANAAIVVSMPVLIVLKGSGYEMMSALGHYAAQSSCPLYPKSGHAQRKHRCPLSAKNGHSPRLLEGDIVDQLREDGLNGRNSNPL